MKFKVRSMTPNIYPETKHFIIIQSKEILERKIRNSLLESLEFKLNTCSYETTIIKLIIQYDRN